jgi:hypothetical protein
LTPERIAKAKKPKLAFKWASARTMSISRPRLRAE